MWEPIWLRKRLKCKIVQKGRVIVYLSAYSHHRPKRILEEFHISVWHRQIQFVKACLLIRRKKFSFSSIAGRALNYNSGHAPLTPWKSFECASLRSQNWLAARIIARANAPRGMGEKARPDAISRARPLFFPAVHSRVICLLYRRARGGRFRSGGFARRLKIQQRKSLSPTADGLESFRAARRIRE